MLLSLALVVGGGCLWPAAGEFLIRHEVLTVGIILSFLFTGLTLETRVIVDALGSLKALSAALLSSLGIYPLIAQYFRKTSPGRRGGSE